MDNSSSPSPASPTVAAAVGARIFSYIQANFQRGRIFFAEDLEVLGEPMDHVRLALSELVQDNFSIVRLARGVFCYPRLDAHAKVVLPDERDVASALAERWGVRIVPCGEQAALLAGLIPFGLHPLRYVSDGSYQYFNLQNGRRIEFLRRKSVKVFRFRNEALRNLVEGFRWLGQDSIGENECAVARRTLRSVPDPDFSRDILLAPGWIRQLFSGLRNG